MILIYDEKILSKYPMYVSLKTHIHKLTAVIDDYYEDGRHYTEPAPYYGEYPNGMAIRYWQKIPHGNSVLELFDNFKDSDYINNGYN